nr:hypothetical protein [uncultured Roseococcus sp.]
MSGAAPIGQVLGLKHVYEMIEAACEAAGGQKAWALRHDLSPGTVGDVVHGRRDPGPKLLKALGLKRVTRYVKVSIPNR